MTGVRALICLVLGLLSSQVQADVTNGPWSWSDGRVTGAELNAVVRSSSGRLLAAGAAGTVLISDDGGASWQAVRTGFGDFTAPTDAPQGGDLHALRWFKGNFIAGGDHLNLLYSPDGLHWKAAVVSGAPAANVTASIAVTGLVDYGGLIVASTSDGETLESSDGVNWAYQTPVVDGVTRPLKGNLLTVYFAVYMVTPGGSGTHPGIYGSQDGVNWTGVQTYYPGGPIVGGVSTDQGANSVLMVEDQVGNLYTTYDFFHWIHVGSAPVLGDTLVWTGNEYALLTGGTSSLAYYLSPDGSSWAPYTGPAPFQAMFSTSNTSFVATGSGGGLYTSPDGAAWTALYTLDLNQYRNPLWDGAEFVVYANGKKYAGNGASWTATPLAGSALPVTLTRGDSEYLGADASGIIQVSPDGVSWTNTGIGSGHGYYAWAQCGSTAAALSGTATNALGTTVFTASAAASSNYLSWTEQATTLPGPPLNLACGNGVFVAALSQSLAVSTDGLSWSGINFPVFSSIVHFTGVSFANGRFIAMETDPSGTPLGFLTSSDGHTWTTQTPTSALPPSVSRLVWDGSEYIGFTPGAQMWVSGDLLSWYQEELPAGFILDAVAAGGGYVLATGASGHIESTAGAGKAPVMAAVNVHSDANGNATGACSATDPNGLALSYAGYAHLNGTWTMDALTGQFTLQGVKLDPGQSSGHSICRAGNGVVMASGVVTVGEYMGSKGGGGGFWWVAVAGLIGLNFFRKFRQTAFLVVAQFPGFLSATLLELLD